MLMSAGLPVSANAINKDVGVHTKVCLNVRHRVVSPARIAERTASPEIRLKLYHTSGLRGSHQHLIAEAPDIFPGGDLGVVKYLARDMLGHEGAAKEEEMRLFAERWASLSRARAHLCLCLARTERIMNTPGHAVVNLLVLGKRDRRSLFAPIAFGAVLPDLPMFVFYAYQKSWLKAPERVIWAEAYHDLSWQAFFDVFNSLPLLALGVLVARRLARPHAAVLFLSMMLHAVCDFALHRKDAHRHFFPFSDWRFQSPVSYWDPRHYGGIVTTIEMVVVVAGAVVLFKQYPGRGPRVFLGLILLCYAFYIGYALVVWA